MSYLAIATVTKALENRLGSILDGVKIICARPASNTVDSPTINVFLFSVSPNPHVRNIDLPTRSSDKTFRKTPALPLDLFYLFTFYGETEETKHLSGQKLLGKTLMEFHEKPRLSIDEITLSHNTITQDMNNQPPPIKTSVKISLHQMSVEEFSKLWALMGDVPYETSLIYKASVAILESDSKAIEPLPVKEPKIEAIPQGLPEIIEILEKFGRLSPIHADSKIKIRGSNINNETIVRVNGIVTESVIVDQKNIIADLSAIEGLQPGLSRIELANYLTTINKELKSNSFGVNIKPNIMGITKQLESDSIIISVKTISKPMEASIARLNLIAKEAGSPNGYCLTNPTISEDSYNFKIKKSEIQKNKYLTTITINNVVSPFDETKIIEVD